MFSRVKHGGTALLVSIGDSGISLAIVDRTNVKAKAQVELPLEERTLRHSGAALLRLLSEQGGEMVKSYAAAGNAAPSSLFVALQAPYALSHIVDAAETASEEHLITDAILDGCARKALGDITASPGFVGANMLQAMLNGYPTNRPEGKRARSVELVGLVSVAEPKLLSGLEAACRMLVPGAALEIRGGTAALIAAARASGDLPADALALRLTHEGSDLVVLRDGIPMSCSFVPVGLRHVAKLALPGQPADALLSTLRIASRGHGSETAADGAEKALASAEPALAKLFGESLSALSASSRLPDTVLLFAPREIEDWFSNFLTRIDFAPFTLAARPFAVRPGRVRVPEDVAADMNLALALFAWENEARR